MPLDPATALQLAKDAYSSSTSYFDASIRKEIEADLRRFQGLHPVGSKYLSEQYRAKSRLFRPKTRAMVTKHEANAAEAFFANRDVVNIEPQDDDDPIQQASAALHKELLQFRLTKTIPWFLTVMGAYQDAATVGLVCSYQHWVFDPVKKKDQPAVDLRPLENIRFDPGANWMDPVNTSPYFIDMIPMYVKDVQARMKTADPKTGEAKWMPVDEATLLTAVKGYSDTIRLQREHGRTDSKENATAVRAYSIVWVHKNIVEFEGTDYCYYTLADLQLLSKPVPIEQTYHHGKRPYVVGYCAFETHKNYPAGPNRKAKDIQAEANEVANTRIENVKLAMNKRYLVGRNRQVDIRSLTRNVAGGATLVNDTEKDVKELEFNDVTASSYKEQEVLNLDFDEVTGNFSSGSVQSNRKMNETLGGMELVEDDSNKVGSYQLNVFTHTWVEPVLRQLILLEQAYETDEVILALAGKKAKVDQLGFDTITDELIEQELILSVSVGQGPTSPEKKVNRFLTAMRALKELLVDGTLVGYGLKFEEVCKEVFGLLGYKDGSRFFDMGDDPRVQQLLNQINTLKQQLEAKQPQALIDAQVRHIDAQIAAFDPKNKQALAQAVKTGVEATYSALQAAEVVAAVPQAAPVADALLQGAGYQLPVPPGVDPNIPTAAAANMPATNAAAVAPAGGLAMEPIKNGHTGTVTTVPGQVPAAGQPGGPAPGDTTPNTPANPRPAGAGAGRGIETMRADGVRGMVDGGSVNPVVDGMAWDDFRQLPTDQMTPSQRATFAGYQKQQQAVAAPETLRKDGSLVGTLIDSTLIGSPRAKDYSKPSIWDTINTARAASVVGSFADGGTVGDMSDPAYRASLEQRQALQPVYPELALAPLARTIGGVARTVLGGGASVAPASIGTSVGRVVDQVGPVEQTAMNTTRDALHNVATTAIANGKELYNNVSDNLGAGVSSLRSQLGLADGGVIQGPGTGTSDSVPAVNADTGDQIALSAGEVKIPAAVVQALGEDFFNKLIEQFHQQQPASTPQPDASAPTYLLQTGDMIIPADVVSALGADFFERLIATYGGAQ